MDCRTARQWLEYHRPRGSELSPPEAAALEGHLATCPECEAWGRVDRAADGRLAEAMRAVAVPAGLQDRLKNRLEADHRRALRKRVFRVGRFAAAAAAVLLVAGGGLAWLRWRPVAVDLAALRDLEFAQYASPRPDWVQDWFHTRHGVTMVAPQAFDYSYLVSYDMGTCQGRAVPQLIFVRGGTRAHVYVVTRRQFDLDRLPDDPGDLASAGFRVDVWRDPEADDTAFLIISTGDSLEPLLAHDKPPPV